MIKSKLERYNYQKCGELRNSHRLQRRYIFHDGKRKPFWDLPRCGASCMWKKGHSMHFGFSRPVKSNGYDNVKELKRELLKCVPPEGKIGDTTNIKGCGNKVGRCAEPHAAKECIIKHSGALLADIVLSMPLCIATLEPMEYCAICKHIFPTLK